MQIFPIQSIVLLKYLLTMGLLTHVASAQDPLTFSLTEVRFLASDVAELRYETRFAVGEASIDRLIDLPKSDAAMAEFRETFRLTLKHNAGTGVGTGISTFSMLEGPKKDKVAKVRIQRHDSVKDAILVLTFRTTRVRSEIVYECDVDPKAKQQVLVLRVRADNKTEVNWPNVTITGPFVPGALSSILVTAADSATCELRTDATVDAEVTSRVAAADVSTKKVAHPNLIFSLKKEQWPAEWTHPAPVRLRRTDDPSVLVTIPTPAGATLAKSLEELQKKLSDGIVLGELKDVSISANDQLYNVGFNKREITYRKGRLITIVASPASPDLKLTYEAAAGSTVERGISKPESYWPVSTSQKVILSPLSSGTTHSIHEKPAASVVNLQLSDLEKTAASFKEWGALIESALKNAPEALGANLNDASEQQARLKTLKQHLAHWSQVIDAAVQSRTHGNQGVTAILTSVPLELVMTAQEQYDFDARLRHQRWLRNQVDQSLHTLIKAFNEADLSASTVPSGSAPAAVPVAPAAAVTPAVALPPNADEHRVLKILIPELIPVTD